MKSRTSPRSLLLLAAALGGAILLTSPTRRAQLVGLLRPSAKASTSVVLMMGRSWVDSGGVGHGAFTVLNEGSGPISRVTVRCVALDARGSTLAQRSHTFESANPIAPGGRAPFEMTIDVMAQTFARMDCELTHAS